MKKRVISILLCVIMVCSLLPIEVFALPSYTIFLDFNGGTLDGETSFRYSVPSYISDTCDVPDKTPVLEGYIFDGWNTEKDGSGVAYSAGDTYTFTMSSTTVTLYAQWKLPNWIDCADTSWYDSNRNATSYTISTAEELAGLAKLVNDGRHFTGKIITLADNISLAGKEWTPIGTTTSGYAFRGTFDGAGCTVSDLYIDASKSDNQALFATVVKATVKNLRVNGNVLGNDAVAGIVASAGWSVIENCVNDCTVNGRFNIGGIVGKNQHSLVTDCYNTANVSSIREITDGSDSTAVEFGVVGGIVGFNEGFVTNCYNIGDIYGDSYLGGIAGKTNDTSVSELHFTDPAVLAKCVANIYNCYNIGSVKGKRNVSGICGFLIGSASKCYNIGILESAETKVYGVALTRDSTTENVADCYYLADCNASGTAFANKIGTALSSENFRKQESFSGFDFDKTWGMGALAPVLKSFNNTGTTDNPYPIANLEMLKYMRDSVNNGGSLFCDCSVVLLRDIDLGCDENNQWEPIGNNTNYFYSNFDGKGHVITGLYINKPDEDYVGFIGELTAGYLIKNLGVYGTVIGRNYVGGIVGFACSQFDNCFNACDVTGNSYIAGILGHGDYSAFSNCYNIGKITCKDDYCGGISTDPYFTSFYHCYNFGTIDCKGDFVDPIAKEHAVENTFESCYYLSGCNAEGTVFDIRDGISALSETDFADKSKFAGWDFDDTWDLSDSDIKRPLLKNAAEKGTSLNPFRVVYTDDKGGAAIHEIYFVTNNSPTPKCQTDTSNMNSWRFVKWDKSIDAKVTGNVTYTAKLSMKAANTVRYHGNGGTCILYGKPSETSDSYLNSETCILKSKNDFTRDGYKLIGWSWGSVSSRFSYKVGDTFKFTYPHNGDTYDFYAIWQDIEKPIFVGLENEKTYCKSVKFKVTDNGGIASVKVGDTTLAADSDGYYTINYHNDQDFAPVDYTVTATDLDGNTTTVSITLRSFHAMSTWGGDDEYVWRTCGYCGEPDDTKYKIPVNCIVGDDTVCRNEDYKFTVTLPSEWYFGECDFTPQLQDDGTYLCVVDNDGERDSLNISFELYLNPGDSHPYNMRVDKTVTVVDHTGGTANCKDKAVCTECGNPYGETDPKNHKYDLERLEAKPATVEEVGNIEYWYCSACDKYYSDKDGNTELSKDEVTLKKLAPEIIEGKGQKISFGESCDLTFRSNAAIADFIRVEIDGVTIDENNYTVKSGSIVVALKGEYVASLSAGEHTIGIVSTGGTATATFTVEAVNNPDDSIPNIPATYGFSNVWLWTAVMFVSGGCLLTELYFRKKPNCNKK